MAKQQTLSFMVDETNQEYYDKIEYSKKRIIEWWWYYKGNVVVSVSGGIDSSVLLDLVRKTIKEVFNKKVVGCFMDTGVEFLEIRETVSGTDNVIILKPKVRGKKISLKDLILRQGYFKKIKLAGYPFWNKEVSMGISRFRNTSDPIQKNLRLNGGINPTSGKKQQRSVPKMFHMLAKKGKYSISNICCNYFKKAPAYLMYKETGLAPYIGMKEADSNLRRRTLKRTGCNAYESKHPKSNPLRYWTDDDVRRYVKENNIKICSLYSKGYDSTGCPGCTYGIAKDKDRFLRLKEHHPATYNLYINKLDYKGFFREVHNYSGIKIRY